MPVRDYGCIGEQKVCNLGTIICGANLLKCKKFYNETVNFRTKN